MIGLAGFSRAACQVINFPRSWHHIHSLSICWVKERNERKSPPPHQKKKTFLVYCSFCLFCLGVDFMFSAISLALCVSLSSVTEPENKQLSVCSVIGHASGISSNSHSTRTRHGRLPICHLYFLWYRYVPQCAYCVIFIHYILIYPLIQDHSL